jgi:hypothetical protein
MLPVSLSLCAHHFSFDLAFVPFLAALVPAVEHTVLILAISPHHIFSLAFLSSP